ncbi:MAG: hypothetical protein Q8K61_01230 [Gallionella sp.]|nr:hypothetical protein [Gallionella sp.]
MTSIQIRADIIIEQMHRMIEQNKLELVRRHAKDLVLHDLVLLTKLNDSKAVLAWCVGHSHSHLVVLGIHPAENSMVYTHVRLASEDKFYKLTLKAAADFCLQETTRLDYPELGNTPVPYSMSGTKLEFTFFKAGAPLAHITIKPLQIGGKWQYHVQYRPINVMTEIDRYAAEVWAHKSIASFAQSVFYHVHDEIWHACEQHKKMALTLLDQYQANLKVSALYDTDPAFAGALQALFPRFEYPDFSHLSVAEVKRRSLNMM